MWVPDKNNDKYNKAIRYYKENNVFCVFTELSQIVISTFCVKLF